jgi:hypothetical protein
VRAVVPVVARGIALCCAVGCCWQGRGGGERCRLVGLKAGHWEWHPCTTMLDVSEQQRTRLASKAWGLAALQSMCCMRAQGVWST